MQRKILIVDDQFVNRMILRNILREDYEVLEAEDGEQALALLRATGGEISAVILDIVMPVLDGYGLLERLRADPVLSQLPVIVTTGNTDAGAEVKALSLGANDYILKPYNAAVIRQRLKNTINLRESSAMVNALRRDPLTGLYNREAFFERARELIDAREPGYYVLSCLDIDNFKIINDQYGSDKGDRVLRHVADTFRSGLGSAEVLSCRISADDFALLYPCRYIGSQILENIRTRIAAPGGGIPVMTISTGRYIVSDKSLSVSAMYDRASLAQRSVKGRFDTHAAVYDEAMRDQLVQEQQIVNEMNGALAGGQFEVWLQPQYNHSTGALVGSEALVRWRHPQRGLIPPGRFIPLFEQNGFIFRMDRYIWEQVCILLRRWLDEGLAPLPVSVNVSRFDLLSGELLAVLEALREKYRLPVELLRLEITESALAADRIIQTARELIDAGYTVEIDDFGSGYSSLNTLKDVPASVLKLDMRFLQSTGASQRGGNIVESVVRMAKWLDMAVIAEGVETIEQANFLKSIGCNYVQGYLYARPMPMAEYEALARTAPGEERLLALETVERLDNNSFWDPASMDTLIFNSYVGAACIFEYDGSRMELLRANEKFARELGGGRLTLSDALKLELAAHADEETRAGMKALLDAAVVSGEEVTGEAAFDGVFEGSGRLWVRAGLRVIARAGSRSLFYCAAENTTAQREAEQELLALNERIRADSENITNLMNDTPGGFARMRVQSGRYAMTFANDGFCKLVDMSREEVMALYGADALEGVHPDDRQGVTDAAARMIAEREVTVRYRLRRGENGYVMLLVFWRLVKDAAGALYVNAYYTDVAEQMRRDEQRRELLDNLPCGAGLYIFENNGLRVLHLNACYRELVGRRLEDPEDVTVIDAVHPDDRALLMSAIRDAVREGRDGEQDIRLLRGDGSWLPVHVSGRVRPSGKTWVLYATYMPISEGALSVQRTVPLVLEAIMNSSSDLSFAKDRELRYICCSRGFAAMAGLSDERDVAGKTDYDLFDRETAEKYRADDRRLFDSGLSIVDMEERIPSEDGVTHYSSTSKYILRDTAGSIIGLYGTGRDITQSRMTHEQLRLLTDSIPGGLATFEAGPDAIHTAYMSDGLYELLGYGGSRRAQMPHGDALHFVLEEDRPFIRAQLSALRQDGSPLEGVFRIRTAAGDCRWVNLRGRFLERRGDKTVINAALFDVTDRQGTDRRLKARAAAAQRGQGSVRYDIHTRTLCSESGPAFIPALGRVIRDVPWSLIDAGAVEPDCAETLLSFFDAIGRGEKHSAAELRLGTATGGRRLLRCEASVLFNRNGEPTGAVIGFSDAADREEQEDEA